MVNDTVVAHGTALVDRDPLLALAPRTTRKSQKTSPVLPCMAPWSSCSEINQGKCCECMILH
jgi:hypothetical protein